MSKLFFDHLLELSVLDKHIKIIAKTPEERNELWLMVDEIVHHKVMGCILDRLPHESHHEFLQLFSENPHDTEIMFDYLRLKIGDDVEELLKPEIDALGNAILEEMKVP